MIERREGYVKDGEQLHNAERWKTLYMNDDTNHRTFQQKFNQNLKVTEVDAIDIYRYTDRKEVRKFLNTAPPFANTAKWIIKSSDLDGRNPQKDGRMGLRRHTAEHLDVTFPKILVSILGLFQGVPIFLESVAF